MKRVSAFDQAKSTGIHGAGDEGIFGTGVLPMCVSKERLAQSDTSTNILALRIKATGVGDRLPLGVCAVDIDHVKTAQRTGKLDSIFAVANADYGGAVRAERIVMDSPLVIVFHRISPSQAQLIVASGDECHVVNRANGEIGSTAWALALFADPGVRVKLEELDEMDIALQRALLCTMNPGEPVAPEEREAPRDPGAISQWRLPSFNLNAPVTIDPEGYTLTCFHGPSTVIGNREILFPVPSSDAVGASCSLRIMLTGNPRCVFAPVPIMRDLPEAFPFAGNHWLCAKSQTTAGGPSDTFPLNDEAGVYTVKLTVTAKRKMKMQIWNGAAAPCFDKTASLGGWGRRAPTLPSPCRWTIGVVLFGESHATVLGTDEDDQRPAPVTSPATGSRTVPLPQRRASTASAGGGGGGEASPGPSTGMSDCEIVCQHNSMPHADQ